MRARAAIHVEGPPGGGKTAFVEAVLQGFDGWVTAVRGICSDQVDELLESAPDIDPELERYRRAGADGVGRIRFPSEEHWGDDFYLTDFMQEPSDAVVIEGDSPLDGADLRVFVAAAPPPGSRLFVRRTRDVAAERRRRIEQWEEALATPEGIVAQIEREMGGDLAPVAFFAQRAPESMRRPLRKMLDELRERPAPEPVRYRAVTSRYSGIERGELVVITVRDAGERTRAESVVRQLARLRSEDELFKDILGPTGRRTPITAVAADLTDARDPGTRKALARVRRAVRRVGA